MAEICLDCWEEISADKNSAIKYKLSRELDFCENCGEWKRVIVGYRKHYSIDVVGISLSSVKAIKKIFCYLWEKAKKK